MEAWRRSEAPERWGLRASITWIEALRAPSGTEASRLRDACPGLTPWAQVDDHVGNFLGRCKMLDKGGRTQRHQETSLGFLLCDSVRGGLLRHEVSSHLNATPCKCLGRRTPTEVFRKKLRAQMRHAG